MHPAPGESQARDPAEAEAARPRQAAAAAGEPVAAAVRRPKEEEAAAELRSAEVELQLAVAAAG